MFSIPYGIANLLSTASLDGEKKQSTYQKSTIKSNQLTRKVLEK